MKPILLTFFLIFFLFISFSANAKLNSVYCDLASSQTNEKLRIELELSIPHKAKSVLMDNDDNLIKEIDVDVLYVGDVITQYSILEMFRLRIELAETEPNINATVMVELPEDEAGNEDLSFNIKDAPFSKVLKNRLAGKPVVWTCGAK